MTSSECFCGAKGELLDSAIETAQEYAHEAPGLLFGATGGK